MTTELRKGYKQTEVGVIPEDWEVEKLSQCVQISSGDSPSKVTFSNEGTAYFKVEQLNNGNKYAKETEYFVTSNIKIPTGSIIFPKRGASIFLNKIRILEQESYMDTNLMTLTPSDEIYNEYLFYQLSHKGLSKIADTTSIPQINNKHINPFSIPLPPTKSEQTAIATALSDSDALITRLEKLIEKKRVIKQGAMQELLKPKEGWEEKSILQLADNKKELFDDGDWIEAEHITTEGIRLLQTGNIGIGKFLDKEGKKYIFPQSFEKLKCKEIHEGDLLICRLAEPAGRACVLPKIDEEKIITSVDVTIFRPRNEVANRIFISYIFSTGKWLNAVSELCGGTTHKRISRGSLGKLKVTFPSSIEEQTRIATILSDMDAEITALEQKLAKYKLIKQGMMQELLTGRIRLVENV